MRTSPTRTTTCSSDHPVGRTLSVTSPMSENTAGRAEGPLDVRERLIQSQLPNDPRTRVERSIQSTGLAEKLTSACMWPSVCRRTGYVKAQGGLSVLPPHVAEERS